MAKRKKREDLIEDEIHSLLEKGKKMRIVEKGLSMEKEIVFNMIEVDWDKIDIDGLDLEGKDLEEGEEEELGLGEILM